VGGVDAGKKRQGRQLSDMLAAYGSGILAGRPPLTYEDWVGLWLNLDRVQRRQAVAVAEGTVAASSPRDLEFSWADAVALLEESAEDLHYRINAERSTARVRAKLGFPEV